VEPPGIPGPARSTTTSSPGCGRRPTTVPSGAPTTVDAWPDTRPSSPRAKVERPGRAPDPRGPSVSQRCEGRQSRRLPSLRASGEPTRHIEPAPGLPRDRAAEERDGQAKVAPSSSLTAIISGSPPIPACSSGSPRPAMPTCSDNTCQALGVRAWRFPAVDRPPGACGYRPRLAQTDRTVARSSSNHLFSRSEVLAHGGLLPYPAMSLRHPRRSWEKATPISTRGSAGNPRTRSAMNVVALDSGRCRPPSRYPGAPRRCARPLE